MALREGMSMPAVKHCPRPRPGLRLPQVCATVAVVDDSDSSVLQQTMYHTGTS